MTIETFAIAHQHANSTRVSPTLRISPTTAYSIWCDYFFACKRSADIERQWLFYKSTANVKKKDDSWFMAVITRTCESWVRRTSVWILSLNSRHGLSRW